MGVVIRVIVVDDHPLYLSGVIQTLAAENDFEVVGKGATGEEAIRLATELLPDILLLDIGIPGGGISSAQTISSRVPAVKIVMLTASEDEENLLAALKAGARAYILKGVSASELIDIIRQVANGDVYVTPKLAHTRLFEISAPRSGGNTLPDDLNRRERQILELLADGYSNREIGQQLFLSEKTVKHYMTNIMQKLQVRNRVEAALLAQRSNTASSKTTR